MGGSLSNFQDKGLVTMIKNILGSFTDLIKRSILRFNPGVAAVDQLSKKIILVAVTHLLFLQLKNKSYTRNRCLTHQPSLPTKIEIVWQRMTLWELNCNPRKSCTFEHLFTCWTSECVKKTIYNELSCSEGSFAPCLDRTEKNIVLYKAWFEKLTDNIFYIQDRNKSVNV